MTPAWERYAAQETYLEVERMVTKFARQTARQYRIDMEEAMSAAHLGFAQAFKTFRPELGYEFTTWCGEKVKRRLQDLVKQAVRAYQEPTVQVEDQAAFAERLRPAFDLDGFLGELSPDAQAVVKLVFAPPTDVKVSMAEIGKEDPEAFRSAVQEFLDDQGWSQRRVKRTFSEIRSKL